MRKALYILGMLDDADVEWIVSHGERQSVQPDQLLIRQGQPIDFLYILIEGELAVRVGTGTETEIARLLPGEIVGEISYVDSRPPSASVYGVRTSRLLALRRDELTRKLAKDYAFAARFYRAIASFLADRLYVTVGRYGYGSAKQDADVDELNDSAMDDLSLATIRFDKLLRFMNDGNRAGSFASVRE